jgi:glycosyltransferase involved in cell wall biosynthesis
MTEQRSLRRVVFIASGVDFARTWEWLIEHLQGRVEFCFILLNDGDSHFERVARESWPNVERVTYRGPRDLPGAFFKIWRILVRWAPDAVHVHLKIAGLVALPAALLAGVKERIYTRHHSTYHHDYFPKAVKQDRFINRCATQIVAISAGVEKVLTDLEGVDPGRVQIIHHGFDLDRARQASPEAAARASEAYNPSGRAPVIGVVARYSMLKGIDYTVEAFRRLLATHPDALLILAGAHGPDQDAIREVVRALPAGSYIEVEFEPDIFALYRLFDVFVHVPVDEVIEAYGMIYVEALAVGVPSIVTLSGVATEFIEPDRHAVVVPYKDSGAIYEALERVLADEGLRRDLIREGNAAVERFGLSSFVEAHAQLYGA